VLAGKEHAFNTSTSRICTEHVRPLICQPPPGARPRRRMHERGYRYPGLRQGPPCSASHLSSFSWCPQSTPDTRTSSSSHGALPCPLHHLQVPAHDGVYTGALVPLAAVRPRPLQHRQVPDPSGVCTCHHIPVAAVLPWPLQHLQLSALSGACTRPPVPRAVLLPRPLQHFQMPSLSGAGTGQSGPRAVLLLRPLQQLQVPALSGVCTSPRVPLAAVLPRPLQHLQVPACSSRAQDRAVHGHPFSFPQASSSTEPGNFVSRSARPSVSPAISTPDDSTASPHFQHARAIRARSVGSRRDSTSAAKRSRSSSSSRPSSGDASVPSRTIAPEPAINIPARTIYRGRWQYTPLQGQRRRRQRRRQRQWKEGAGVCEGGGTPPR